MYEVYGIRIVEIFGEPAWDLEYIDSYEDEEEAVERADWEFYEGYGYRYRDVVVMERGRKVYSAKHGYIQY
jgi:hypothetical protein